MSNIETLINHLEQAIAEYKGRLRSESSFLKQIAEALTRYVERMMKEQ